MKKNIRFLTLALVGGIAISLSACETGGGYQAQTDGVITRPAPASSPIKVSGYAAASATTTR
jgi:hypothetical protein